MALIGRLSGQNVKGLDKVLRNVNKELNKISSRCERGVYKGALYIKARALEKTPIDTGNLRGSCYLDPPYPNPTIEIGYTADYAIYVHEIDKNYKAPGTSWKYLEKALNENKKKFLQFVKKG